MRYAVRSVKLKKIFMKEKRKTNNNRVR